MVSVIRSSNNPASHIVFIYYFNSLSVTSQLPEHILGRFYRIRTLLYIHGLFYRIRKQFGFLIQNTNQFSTDFFILSKWAAKNLVYIDFISSVQKDFKSCFIGTFTRLKLILNKFDSVSFSPFFPPNKFHTTVEIDIIRGHLIPVSRWFFMKILGQGRLQMVVQLNLHYPFPALYFGVE